MFHTPAHKQQDPAKYPGQLVNPIEPPALPSSTIWWEEGEDDGDSEYGYDDEEQV